jgi:hypothetical protein
MTTEVEQSKLNIHVLTQNQYEGLPSVSDTELYIVDPQFQGGKFLASDTNGDIIEKDALEGVQLAGTDLTPDANNKVNIPLATNDSVGVLRGNPAFGTTMSNSTLCVQRCTENDMKNKNTNYKPVVAADIDIAVREGLGNYNTALRGEWLDTYKEHACDTIGATQTEIVDWIES